MSLVGVCVVCKRRHDNVGYASNERRPVKWACLDCLNANTPEGTNVVKRVYHMPRKELDEFEKMALSKAGEAAGSYLDQLGRTDMAALELHEWNAFLGKILQGYETAMREMLEQGKAPF